MRIIAFETIVEHTKRLCIEASHDLGELTVKRSQSVRQTDASHLGKEIPQRPMDNVPIAPEESYPIRQDASDPVFFVELGEDIRIEGGALVDAINKGVAEAYGEGYLGYSIVADPLRRRSNGDNTSAMVTLQLVRGDRLRLSVLPNGGRCENMSVFKMLTPADGVKGVKDFVLDAVGSVTAKPFPAVVVGVGLGGTFDVCCMLAKKALFRELGAKHPDPFYAQLEAELLDRINKLGIGTMRPSGRTIGLAVHVETLPCHIASLPVAVDMDWHAHGRKSILL